MNQSSNNGGGWVLDVLDDLIGGSDGSPEERVQRLQFRATIESAMALPGKWRAEADEQRDIARNPALSDDELAWHVALAQKGHEDANELEAIFGPAQPFLSGEGDGVSNASEPPATDAPEGMVLVSAEHLERVEQRAASLYETLAALAHKLGIDFEQAKNAPGKPSDVYIEAARQKFATLPAGGGDDLLPLRLLGRADDAEQQGQQLLADELREAARRLAYGGGASLVEWDGATRTMQEHLYFMTGERDRYKARAEHADEQVRALAHRIAEASGGCDPLQAFKDYTHQRLDAMGVPVDPESPHKAAGCRIGGRLDWIEQRLAGGARVGQEAPDWNMAQHWIDRYAGGIDDELQLDRVADALGLPDPTPETPR